MLKTVVAIGLVVLLAGCGFEPGPRRPSPFHVGDTVRMKVGSGIGMITYVWCPELKLMPHTYCHYSVRFPSLQLTTDARLLGRDGPITLAPVTLVNYIQEFELKLVERGTDDAP